MADPKKIAKNAEKVAARANDTIKFIQYTQQALIQSLLFQAETITSQRKTIKMLILSVIVLSIGLVVAATREMPEAQVYGRDKNGHFYNLVPLNKNDVHLTNIRIWAETCVIDSLDLSFINTLNRINKILNSCFSDQGKKSYQNWLLAGTSDRTISFSNNSEIYADSELGMIIEDEVTLNASPKSPGRLREIQPITDGETGESIKRWELTFSILLRKQEGLKGSGTSTKVAKVIMSRTNNPAFEYGVSIDSYSLSSSR
ncbi:MULTISPECIES: hypothetical protein [Vibrio]|uniref:Bacterial virulence protein VirB8 domain-containing protein n=1 Tax=Vibrio tasmaniensis TaxID=212663 RepID=A0A2N7NNF5_9VIBR|nr:hypothetical protein [Vibrio tasmaniensis]PMO80338.1 hypothetical protein BCT01_08585 [Vibrio tasmaniensis]PMP17794.1 hypothetical protein BCS92_05145 [Vibrio tasmaniensis]TKG28999.1 hypothetical protein FC057_20145 [Vibrio tasmaniensis]TKG41602.1 hypothetical protein FC063_07005 [Vibrio tasmaniensis]TKG46251.1 hypothetical protein FC070_22470 [Vibrio tasmaniensis]